jgi:HEAT repeat protein
MASSLNDFLDDELSSERVAEVVESQALDPTVLVEKYLFDGRVFLRRNAASALAQMGALTVDNLHWVVVASKDGDPLVREHVTAALPTVGLEPAQAFEALANRLSDRESAVVQAAEAGLEQLIQIDANALAPLLVAHLTDLRPKLGVTCQELLLRIAGPAAPLLVSACIDGDLGLATAARATLERLGTSAQGALIEALPTRIGRFRLVALLDLLPAAVGAERTALEGHAANEIDLDLVRAAQRLLDKPPPEPPLGPPVYPSDDFDEVMQTDALLGGFVTATPDRASLLRGAQDFRPILRANCAALLGLLGRDEDTRRVVAALVRDADVSVRCAASTALGPLGAPAALLVALADADQGVRGAAVGALGALPPETIASLAVSASNAPEALQSVVHDALAHRGKQAIAGLKEALVHAPTIPSRVFAAVALGGLTASHAAAVEAISLGLSDESGEVQSASVLGLIPAGASASAAARTAVREAFEDTTHDAVLRACSRALDAFDGRQALPLALEPVVLPLPDFDTVRLDTAALQPAVDGADVTALDELLFDGRAVVRANTLALLALLGEAAQEAIGGVALCLKDAEPAVRLAAAEALGQLALDPPLVVPALVHRRSGASVALLAALDDAIVAYGADAVPPLIALIGASATVADDALAVLATLGAPAAKALVMLLGHDALTLRVAGARGLGGFGERAGKTVRKAVADAFDAADEPELLRACSAALDAIDGRVPPPAVAEERDLPVDGFESGLLDDAVLKKGAAKMDAVRLGELLFDGRTSCRVNAARALGHVGKGAAAFVGALTVALKDSEPTVRVASAEALGRVKSNAAVVVPGLAFAAGSDRSDEVRDAALSAMDALGSDAVAPCMALLEAEASRAAVIGVIAARAPKTYLKPLTTALEGSESPRAQENAALAIAQLGPAGSGAEKALLAVVASSDVPLKCIAIRALGDVAKPTPGLIESLRACALSDERESVEGAVRQALRALKRR